MAAANGVARVRLIEHALDDDMPDVAGVLASEQARPGVAWRTFRVVPSQARAPPTDWILDLNAGQLDRMRLVATGFTGFASVRLANISTAGNPVVQLTITSGGAADQFTIFGVTMSQSSSSNVLVV